MFSSCNTIKCSLYDIEKIMKRVDIDNSGYIEYQEFLSASLDIRKVLTDENLLCVYWYTDTKEMYLYTYDNELVDIETKKIILDLFK